MPVYNPVLPNPDGMWQIWNMRDVYTGPNGGEVRLPAWRQQFVGKTVQSPIKVGSDIANISGATLSCTHLTEGIKRIAGVIDLARSSGQIGAGA